MRTLTSILADSPLFTSLSPEQTELIAGCAWNVRFNPGQTLFREGDPADTFYLMRHGSVQIETFVPATGAIAIDIAGPGEAIGWSWLFPPYRWHFDARALDVVRATAFDGACLREKSQADYTLGYQLMKRFAQLLVERLQATQQQLLDTHEHA